MAMDDTRVEDEIEKLLNNKEEKEEVSSELSLARRYALLCAVLSLQFLSKSSDTFISPFFPVIASKKGLAMVEVGAVFSAYGLARFIAAPFFGSIIVKWPPKGMCAVGALTTAVSCAAFGTFEHLESKEWFLVLCLIIRIIAGAGSAMVIVAGTSMLLKASGFSSSTVMALVEIFNGLSFIAGPVIGGALFELAGYSSMFWIFGAIQTAVIPIYLLVVPTTVEKKKEEMTFLSVMAIPGCTLMFVISALVESNAGFRNIGISDFITSQLNGTSFVIGLLFASWSVCYIIGCAAVAKVIQKFKRSIYPIMLFGLFSLAAASIFTGPSALLDFIFHGKKYLWTTAIAAGFDHVSMACLYVAPLPAALNLAIVNGYKGDSLQTYGMMSALVTSGWSFGSAVGPLAAGLLEDALNFEWAMTIVGFVDAFVGIILIGYMLYMKYTNQPLAPINDRDVVSSEQDLTEETRLQEESDAFNGNVG